MMSDDSMPAAVPAPLEKTLHFPAPVIDFGSGMCYHKWEHSYITCGGYTMEHIKTIETRNLCESAKNGGCGECQTSCQSACKTSCGIANQQCEGKESK